MSAQDSNAGLDSRAVALVCRGSDPDRAIAVALAEAGAEIVSYVPNNAYFVKLGAAAAEELKAAKGVQAVLPFEPYYKLDAMLLALALREWGALPRSAPDPTPARS